MNRYMAYTYDGMLFTLKKGNPDIWNMGDPEVCYIKWKKASHRRTNSAWFHLHEVSKITTLVESESGMVVAQKVIDQRP